MDKELSIFIDESGDLGTYQKHSPYYIVTFVFHNQKELIDDNLKLFNDSVMYLDLPNNYIHAGPIIRQEDKYYFVSLKNRRKAIDFTINFIRTAPIRYQSFLIKRNENNDNVSDTYNLSILITDFIRRHNDYFEKEDFIKIYYDDGQAELSKTLASAMSFFRTDIIFKKVETAKDYRLFQVADVICTLELINQKIKDNCFSKAETTFFKTESQFRTNYYNKILKKRID